MVLIQTADRVPLAGIGLDPLTERQVVDRITGALETGQGGWVATPNIDICRLVRRDLALTALVSGASLAVPDGMPLLWAARLRGTPLPERVTGSSLIFTLTEAAALAGKSIYLLGGAPGTPEQAALALTGRYPGLKVAGTDAPPLGFELTPAELAAVAAKVTAAAPDIIYVGLGFPKQERLIERLAPALPAAWFIACGAAIPFAAGSVSRAPEWMQRSGLEWLHRLATEPRRLFSRYLLHDAPFAARLLTAAMLARFGRPGRS